jgi:DNA-binding FadR family transcriptional regulator
MLGQGMQQIRAGKRSVVDVVTEALFTAILDGTYGPGARLPAERELAAELDASRVSVRAAVRRLVDAGVIITRHGSGATVLARRHWSMRALAGVLHYGLVQQDWDGLEPVVRDALDLRRSLMLDLIERAAGQLGGRRLDRTRKAVEQAWASRADAAAFARQERAVVPTVLETAGMHASLGLVNSLAEPYLAVIAAMAPRAPVPANYVAAHMAVLDALEAGDGAEARRCQSRYLDDLDRSLLKMLPQPLRKRLSPRAARRARS